VIRTWAAWKEPAAPPLRALLELLQPHAVGRPRAAARTER